MIKYELSNVVLEHSHVTDNIVSDMLNSGVDEYLVFD